MYGNSHKVSLWIGYFQEGKFQWWEEFSVTKNFRESRWCHTHGMFPNDYIGSEVMFGKQCNIPASSKPLLWKQKHQAPLLVLRSLHEFLTKWIYWLAISHSMYSVCISSTIQSDSLMLYWKNMKWMYNCCRIIVFLLFTKQTTIHNLTCPKVYLPLLKVANSRLG